MGPIQWSLITRAPCKSHHRDSQRWDCNNKCTHWLWYRLQGFSLPVKPRQCQLRVCADEPPGQKYTRWFFIIIDTRTGEQRHVCFPLETLEQHISHGRMVRYKSYSSAAVRKPATTSLREHINRFFFFLAQDGLAAFKVVVFFCASDTQWLSWQKCCSSSYTFWFQKFKILQLVKQFTSFHGTVGLITVLSGANHWRLSWAS